MQIIVATDIHGTHQRLRSQLAVLGETIIVSPWSGEGKPFPTEQEAVLQFHRQDGLARYEKTIAAAAGGDPCVLIGFSVGATCLWRYASGPLCHPASLAFLYYGSRIRDHGFLVPRCPATLIFAANEASFDPFTLAGELRSSGSRCEVIPDTQHGFMNPASCHYRPDLAEEQFRQLARAIRAHRSALP